MLAGAVHPHGVNLESLLAIVTPIVTALSFLARRILKKVAQGRAAMGKQLLQIGEHLERQDQGMRDLSARQDRGRAQLSERMARLEGPLTRIANGHGSSDD